MTFRAAGVAHLSTIDGDDVMILEIPPDSFSCNLKALGECLRFPSRSMRVPLSWRTWDRDRRRFDDKPSSLFLRHSGSGRALNLRIGPDLYTVSIKELQAVLHADGPLEEATISMSVREARQLDDATSKQTALGGS